MASDGAPDLGTYSLTNGVEIPKIRTVDDFILDKARFESPPLNDLVRWNNRIMSNLLYYQTNYFAIILFMFVLSSLFNAEDLVLGLMAVVLTGGVAVFSLSPNTMFQNTRRDHPLVTLGAIFIAAAFFYRQLNSVLVLAFSLLLPTFFVLIHASTRLRNFRAKVNQAAERMGLKETLMGKILDALGCNVQA